MMFIWAIKWHHTSNVSMPPSFFPLGGWLPPLPTHTFTWVPGVAGRPQAFFMFFLFARRKASSPPLPTITCVWLEGVLPVPAMVAIVAWVCIFLLVAE